MKKWIDRVTGRFTMYRTVFIILLAISVVALVLSLVGQLSYDPLELLASYAAAVASTILSSLLVAKLFGAKAHLESAAITGILLFMVLVPTLDPVGLAAIAAAGVLASASKFLLAWRGRHIVNPAAFGALLVTAFGLTYSGWWVATPVLLPLVALGSLVVLYRTRRLPMALVFIGVAVAIGMVRYGLTGDPVAGLEFALLSYPVVFLAGFMLSEPLTMPPRRWQQLLFAVVVAVLLMVPFNVGPLYSSPQLALVVANVLAFAFGQRRGLVLTLQEKTALTPTTWEFTFRPSAPVKFIPGQYLELTVPHAGSDAKGQRRMFSISSAPGELVTVTLKVTDPVSSYKRSLLELEPGGRLRASLVAGDFALPSIDTPVLLVAGGIGITPFASQLAHAVEVGEQRDIVVVYAVNAVEELAYADLLERSGARVIVTAPVMPGRLPAGWTYGGPRVTQEVLQAEVPDLARRRAFVSGPPSLVNDVRVVLRRLGARRVTTDYFSGY